jgi:flavin prenyltransferase
MRNDVTKSRILVGVTGASGSVYADRLVQILMPLAQRIYVVYTDAAKQVIKHELSTQNSSGILLRAVDGKNSEDEKAVIRIFQNADLFAPVASGSSAPDAMVVVPCSMGSTSRIAQGSSSNLLERVSDVMLKHKRQLIVCPRETPFNLIHLRNLTALAEAGAEVLPLMPAFYQKPETVADLVDFCVGRIVEQLGFSHDLYKKWNSRML